jgi:hypothetical protein
MLDSFLFLDFTVLQIDISISDKFLLLSAFGESLRSLPWHRYGVLSMAQEMSMPIAEDAASKSSQLVRRSFSERKERPPQVKRKRW